MPRSCSAIGHRARHRLFEALNKVSGEQLAFVPS